MNVSSGIADLGLDETSDIVIVGGDELPPAFGCTSPEAPPSNNDPDAYVVKLRGADGSCVWDHRFGAAKTQKIVAVSVSKARQIFVAGGYDGPFQIGGRDVLLAGIYSSAKNRNGGRSERAALRAEALDDRLFDLGAA